MLLEKVGHLVVWAVIEANRVVVTLPLPLRDAGRHVVELTASVLVEIEERCDGRHHSRFRADAGEVFFAEVERAQQRLVEQPGEAVVDPVLAEAPHEVFDRNAVDLECLKEQRQLNDALALLYEAQICG